MIYRANRKDNGKRVYGYLMSPNQIMVWDKKVCMRSESYEIRPETLAMETTIKDKNDNMIFGSIPVDEKMSEGGDEVKLYTGHWTGWQNGKVTWQLEGSVGWCIERPKEKWRYSLNTNDTLEIINPNPDQPGKG